MVFFYEMLFVVVAVVAVILGEAWSRLAALLLVGGFFGIVTLGAASFGARLAVADGLSDEERRWYTDARDGLRHLRLLFGLAALAALAWRLIAG